MRGHAGGPHGVRVGPGAHARQHVPAERQLGPPDQGVEHPEGHVLHTHHARTHGLHLRHGSAQEQVPGERRGRLGGSRVAPRLGAHHVVPGAARPRVDRLGDRDRTRSADHQRQLGQDRACVELQGGGVHARPHRPHGPSVLAGGDARRTPRLGLLGQADQDLGH